MQESEPPYLCQDGSRAGEIQILFFQLLLKLLQLETILASFGLQNRSWALFGLSLSTFYSTLGPNGPNVVPTVSQSCPSSSQRGPTWTLQAKLAPRTSQIRLQRVTFRAILLYVSLIWGVFFKQIETVVCSSGCFSFALHS